MRAIYNRIGYRAQAGRCLYGMLMLAAAAIALSPFAVAAPVYTTLHGFEGGTDGALSAGDSLIRRGNVLYGVAAKGGRDSCPAGCGLAYTLRPTADPQAWQKDTIYFFLGGGRGYRPRGQLLFGTDGALYGVASRGGFDDAGCSGNSDGSSGCGLVYKLTPPDTSGERWTQTVLYRFKNYDDGIWPIGGLLLKSGELYGTTSSAGSNSNGGTAFKLTPSADPAAPWIKKNLTVFKSTDGLNPNAALTFHGGKLYGTTTTGVNLPGSVFELSPPVPSSTNWTLKILHKFSAATGSFPQFVKVVFDQDGRLYGTAAKGGADCTGGPSGCGVVFRLVPPSPPKTAWTYQIIHRFRPGSDGFAGKGGGVPVGGIVFDPDGAAYGVASQGGKTGAGVIYKLTPPPDDIGPWTQTVLYNNGHSNVPQAVLIVSGQSLYGTLSPTFVGTGEAFRLKQ